MARRVSSPEFVARGSELAALLAALKRAADGEFSAVFLAGESGVGKSRLLNELARTAEGRGARVLSGDCVRYSAAELPYAPVRPALRQLLRELDPAGLDEVLGGARAELARLVPELGPSASTEEATTGEAVAQARLFELLLGVLGRLGEEAPVLLAIEDIHWADRSTLDFLAFLISNARRERLLLVCSYRTEELHRGHPLRPFLAQHETRTGVERLDLRPFTPEELATQLHGILGRPPDPTLAQGLHARSEGNAFFTEELLAASTDGGELPASLRDTLLLRIEVLGERVQRLLRLAAAHGRIVPHRLLAAVSELSDSELHGALREAVARHVLVRHDEDTYAFRHALLQETLESDLLPGERADLHLALAAALEDDPTLASRDGRAAAELHGHWLAAGRLPKALAAAVRAGVEAEQVSAFADASHHFRSALELWQRVGDAEAHAGLDQVALGIRAADSAYLAGDDDAAIGLISAARDRIDTAADPYRAAVVRARLGRYLWLRGDMDGAQSAQEEAVDLLPADEPRQERARVLATLAGILMLDGRTAESVESCEQAIQVARQVGAGAEEAHALNTLGVNLGFLGDRTTGIEHLRRSMQMCEELRDTEGVVRAFHNLSDALDQDGRVEEAVELALAGAHRAGEAGMREPRLMLEAEAAMYLVKLGRLEEADRLTDRALELRPSLAKLHRCANRARVEIHRGRRAEAEMLVEAAAEVTPTRTGAHFVEPLASAQVELELLRGRPGDARLRAERTLQQAPDRERVFYTARLHSRGARACALLAERARAAGDERAAAEAAAGTTALLDRLELRLAPEGWRGPPPSETLAYRELCAAEALRAAGTAAATDWAAVADRWAAVGLPLEQAYARLREAECLVVDGQPKAAEQAVTTGLRITAQAGARWLQGQLESLARRARLSLPEGSRADRAPTAPERLGLTDRELAVLELVALGKTNREIGEELFMARKTASVHVSRIISKLGVSSRVEAATAAQRLGIVP